MRCHNHPTLRHEGKLRNAALDFLGVVHTERGLDVTLRYTFPASGLDATAMGTLLMLVVSTASQLRDELLAESSQS